MWNIVLLSRIAFNLLVKIKNIATVKDNSTIFLLKQRKESKTIDIRTTLGHDTYLSLLLTRVYIVVNKA